MEVEAILRLQLAELEVRLAKDRYSIAAAQSKAARSALKRSRRHLDDVRKWAAAGAFRADPIPAKEAASGEA